MAGCFEGLTVLDFCNNIAGPTCAAMMADFGAKVIKIEKPTGDDSRRYAPRLGHRAVVELWYNRGKDSVTVDMNDPDGIAFIKKLVAKADVIVEAFRPGIMAKFGLDYETVHKEFPRIVYCSISAYGQTGPMSKQGGYDTVVQAVTGLMDLTGEANGAPTKLGTPLLDYGTAHNAFAGIAAALYSREKTGMGQWVNVSLFNTGMSINNFVEQHAIGVPTTRKGNVSAVVAPVGNYTGKHGTLCISCNNDKMWEKCAKAMGREDLITHPDFATNVARGKNTMKVSDIMVEWLNTFDDIETPDKILQDAGVPCHAVLNTQEAMDLAEWAQTGAIADMELVDGLDRKTIKVRGVHILLSETPGKLPPCSHELGADTLKTLAECGYSEAEAKELADRWTAK